MRRVLNCVVIAVVYCAIGPWVPGSLAAQDRPQGSLANGQRPLRQSRDEIAALPPSSDVASSLSSFGDGRSNAPDQRQPHSSFFRQASSQTDVYNYPAVGAPRSAGGSRSNYALSRNNADARLTNQMSLGSNTSTGNLGSGNNNYNQAPVYNLNPYTSPAMRLALNTGPRDPVEQQQSSTLPSQQSNRQETSQFTSAQQAQAEAMELARQAQAQQAQAQQTYAQALQAQARAGQLAQATQPTTAYRQSVYQQPTLGLGGPQARTAQCCTPGYNPTSAAYQAPALNPSGGVGVGIPPLNMQTPGQVCCQPNYQFQPNVGTPQFGAQGARWWTPFVTGSGVYTPLLKLRNMPAGTYLGQGIIGQPTAYVDGQPVRNLMRYISP